MAFKPLHFARHFVPQREYFLDTLESLVHEGRAFEVHFGAETLAGAFGERGERTAVRAQEFGNAIGLSLIFNRPYSLLARSEATAHFAVDAAGMRGSGFKIFLTAAQLEQIEKLGFELRRRGAIAERTEVNGPRAAEVGCQLRTGESVGEHKLHVRRQPKADFVAICAAKMFAREIQHQKLRLKPRARELVFDACGRSAQVQRTGGRVARSEQA